MDVNLSVLEKDGQAILDELKSGNMVVVRSKNDFLYVLQFDKKFHMFSHTPGATGGGQKQFPVDDKYTAVVKNLATLADAVFKVEFDRSMNLYGVLASAEEGILSLFPGGDREGDADVEFIIPDKESDDKGDTADVDN